MPFFFPPTTKFHIVNGHPRTHHGVSLTAVPRHDMPSHQPINIRRISGYSNLSITSGALRSNLYSLVSTINKVSFILGRGLTLTSYPTLTLRYTSRESTGRTIGLCNAPRFIWPASNPVKPAKLAPPPHQAEERNLGYRYVGGTAA